MNNTTVNTNPNADTVISAGADTSTNTLGEKSQTKVFSTIVKALSLLTIFAFFLPFAYVSCMPVVNETISGYSLAFGGAADRAAALSEGNMGLGMGMGAGQLAALNMLAGVNLLLAIAFIGTGLLFCVSLLMGRTRLELALSLVIAAFSLAAYLQWLGIFSAFADMFAAAAMQGSMMSAGPSFGLYAVIAFSSLLLLAGILEATGKLPAFLTKGEEEPPVPPVSPVTASVAAQQPAGYYYVPNQDAGQGANQGHNQGTGQTPPQPVEQPGQQPLRQQLAQQSPGHAGQVQNL